MYGNHLKYFENFKKELERRSMRTANLSYRKQLKDMQNKENYLTEIHRIRGVLSQNDNRLPIGARERLTQRIKEIQNLKYGAFDNEISLLEYF